MSTRFKIRWETLLTWDGALPLLAGGLPMFLKHVDPRDDVVELVTVLFVPIVTALVRTAVGMAQLRKLGPGHPAVWRQTAMAGAIVLLLMFEGLVSALSFANDEPAEAWMAAGLIYLGYLFCATAAFAVSRRPLAQHSI